MNNIYIKLEDCRLLNNSEIKGDQVELRINLAKKSNRQTQTKYQIIIQAIDLDRKLCLAECSSNEFTMVSHSRYLDPNMQQQRLELQRHTEAKKKRKFEEETHETGFGLSCVGLQQISGRLLTGQYVRFPILSLGGRFTGCSNVLLQYWLVQLYPGQEYLHQLVPCEYAHICQVEDSMECEEEDLFLSGSCEKNIIELYCETEVDIPQPEQTQILEPEELQLQNSFQTQNFEFSQPQNFEFSQPQNFEFFQPQNFEFSQPQNFEFFQPNFEEFQNCFQTQNVEFSQQNFEEFQQNGELFEQQNFEQLQLQNDFLQSLEFIQKQNFEQLQLSAKSKMLVAIE